MRSLRPTFTERRRRTLALRVAEIEKLEPRSTVTPVGLGAFAIGSITAAGELGLVHANGGG